MHSQIAYENELLFFHDLSTMGNTIPWAGIQDCAHGEKELSTTFHLYLHLD